MSSTSAPPSATTSTPSSTVPSSTDSTDLKTKPHQSIPSKIRIQLSQDATETAAQAEIPANGTKAFIKGYFGNLGTPLEANRITILSGVGKVSIFAHQRSLINLIEIDSDGRSDVTKVFPTTDLSEGFILAFGPEFDEGNPEIPLPGTIPGSSESGGEWGPGPVQLPGSGSGSGTGPVLGPGPVQLPGSGSGKDNGSYSTSGSGTATTNAGTGP